MSLTRGDVSNKISCAQPCQQILIEQKAESVDVSVTIHGVELGLSQVTQWSDTSANISCVIVRSKQDCFNLCYQEDSNISNTRNSTHISDRADGQSVGWSLVFHKSPNDEIHQTQLDTYLIEQTVRAWGGAWLSQATQWWDKSDTTRHLSDRADGQSVGWNLVFHKSPMMMTRPSLYGSNKTGSRYRQG